MLRLHHFTYSTVFKRFRLRRHLSRCGTRLLEVSQGLLMLASRSEREFLSLGERLQEFSSTSRQISRQVKLSLQKLSSTGDDAILVNIRHLLERAITTLREQSENMARSVQHMEPIGERLYQVSKLQDDFQKISRILSILGTSIKIESNRTDTKQGQEFMILGDEVEQIWSHINQHTENMLSQTARSARLVNSARKHIKDRLRIYQTLITKAQKSILSALAEVEEIFQLSSVAMNGLAECAQQISREIGEIVFSLQSHDISRQQIEHVHDALDEAGNRLKNPSSPGATSLLAYLPAASRNLLIQRSQLENVSLEMDQAGTRIRKSLTEIAGKLEREDESFAAFRDNTHSREMGKVELLKEEISQLASILNQCQGLEEEISQALKPTIQSAVQVEKSMKEMEKVGYAINLLSLNALIKSAQNLESGQTFAVLAEEIHQQAILSCELSEQACREISSLIKESEYMDKALNLFSEQKNEAASIIRLTMDNAHSLKSLNRELSALISLLGEKNSQLASGLVAVARDIRFDEMFRTTIMLCTEALENIRNEIQDFVMDIQQSGREGQTADTELVDDHYTMEKERQIHLQAILGASVEKENSQETLQETLFEYNQDRNQQDHRQAEDQQRANGRDQNEGHIQAQNRQEQDQNEIQSQYQAGEQAPGSQEESLGDNVELF